MVLRCILHLSHSAAMPLQPVFQFRKSVRHPLVLAFIILLVNAASRVSVDERANILRDAGHFVAQAGGFFLEAGRIGQLSHQFFCVFNDKIPVRQQLIERREEFLLDGFLGQVRRVGTSVFPLNLPLHCQMTRRYLLLECHTLLPYSPPQQPQTSFPAKQLVP